MNSDLRSRIESPKCKSSRIEVAEFRLEGLGLQVLQVGFRALNAAPAEDEVRPLHRVSSSQNEQQQQKKKNNPKT